MIVEGKILIAEKGKVIRRKHDGFVFDNRLTLGVDYSFDKKGREDKPEYYDEIPEPVEDMSNLENNILSE